MNTVTAAITTIGNNTDNYELSELVQVRDDNFSGSKTEIQCTRFTVCLIIVFTFSNTLLLWSCCFQSFLSAFP